MGGFEFLDSWNTWISSHIELLTIIGAPLVTLIVTTLVSRSSERRATKDRQEARDLQRAMKIAEFRREWIEALRTEFIEVLAHLEDKPRDDVKQTDGFKRSVNRIALLVNHSDADALDIVTELRIVVAALRDGEAVNTGELIAKMRAFLKKEWEKLKDEIKLTSAI
ncbi:hypothetical protein J3R80_12155 [Aliiroseovarius sp. Z3]|uniref:hypothetical protein n=1 Tax=Aliiroseovarius sp. Z3 TaxID=2811402 RepID=UPI0023B2840E|nr:hypothetical protein [Aliiroseovarius sp. Z3]MDE9451218.1 hypothetical protein [Aliiroseovarius sp. Z3]